MPKQSEGTHNPSQSSLRRWDNDGGAPAGGRTKRPKESEPAAEGQGKESCCGGGSGKWTRASKEPE